MTPYKYYIYGENNDGLPHLYYRYHSGTGVYEYWHWMQEAWRRSITQSDMYLKRIPETKLPKEALA